MDLLNVIQLTMNDIQLLIEVQKQKKNIENRQS